MPARRYIFLCTAIGLALSWVPAYIHGPIREKWDYYYLNGGWAIWTWYLARAGVGFFVGITVWPTRWWVRGPLIGMLLLLPPCMMSLANPLCGVRCVAGNESTAAGLGLIVAGVAFALTGLQNAADRDGGSAASDGSVTERS